MNAFKLMKEFESKYSWKAIEGGTIGQGKESEGNKPLHYYYHYYHHHHHHHCQHHYHYDYQTLKVNAGWKKEKDPVPKGCTMDKEDLIGDHTYIHTYIHTHIYMFMHLNSNR